MSPVGSTLTATALGAVALIACGGSAGDGADVPSAPVTAPAVRSATATATAPPRRRARPKPLPGLPADTAGFMRWTRLNARPIPPDSADSRRVGFDAHRSTKQVYVNRAGARRRAGGRFPNGSVVIKAGRVDGAITLVAIMRKVAGADREHGDWRFREFLRSDASRPFTTSARLTGATCWSCHSIARSSDWVFTASG